MGAMKAIYTDCEELQEAALALDLEDFLEYLTRTGWKSPTEVQAEARRAAAAESLTLPASVAA